MYPRFTDKAQREMEECFNLQREALQILDVVVAEWESDPTSVQCFDTRMVDRAKVITKRLKQITPSWEL